MKRPILLGLILAICIPAMSTGAGYYDCRGVVANGAVGTAGGWYEAVAAVGQSAVGAAHGESSPSHADFQEFSGIARGRSPRGPKTEPCEHETDFASRAKPHATPLGSI